MLRTNRRTLIRVLVVAVALLAAVLCMARKESWHLDEIATLGLANGSQDGYITAYDDTKYGRGAFLRDVVLGDSLPEAAQNVREILSDLAENGLSGFSIRDQYLTYTRSGTPVWKPGDDFRAYLLADGFSISDVYVNQLLDNHPPLYYLFVRAAYAVYDALGGTEITLIPAFCVNLLFLCGCCLVLMRIGEKRFGSLGLGAGAALFFALCPAGLSLAVYMRMYMALCFFVLLNLDAHLALWQNGWRFTKKLSWHMAVTCALGFLTHYYFAVWALLTGAVCFAFMLAAKCPRRVFGYVGRMAVGVALSLVLWPFSVVHLLLSQRGVDTVGSLTGGTLERFLSGANIFLRHVFGSAAWLPLLVIALGIACMLFGLRRAVAREARAPLFISVVPALMYLSVVFIIAPYEDLRYMSCAVPLFSLLAAFCLWQAARLCSRQSLRTAVCALLCAAAALSALATQQPMYLYPGAAETRGYINAVQGKKCVYLTGTRAGFFREMPDFAQYDEVLIVTKDELPLLADDEKIANAQEIVLYINDSYSQIDAMRAIFDVTPFTEYEFLAQGHQGLDARVYLISVAKDN